eukprot:2281951-Pleurochrysis_carterae.AAC.4
MGGWIHAERERRRAGRLKMAHDSLTVRRKSKMCALGMRAKIGGCLLCLSHGKMPMLNMSLFMQLKLIAAGKERILRAEATESPWRFGNAVTHRGHRLLRDAEAARELVLTYRTAREELGSEGVRVALRMGVSAQASKC